VYILSVEILAYVSGGGGGGGGTVSINDHYVCVYVFRWMHDDIIANAVYVDMH